MKKKLLFFALMVVTGVATNAQSRLGVIGGLNFANANVTQNGVSQKGTSITSFHAGILIDNPLSAGFYLQPQLLFSGKGTKGLGGQANVYYIEIPVNVVYKYDMGLGRLFAGLGPYGAIGVIGVRKFDSESHNMTFGSGNEADIKRFDAGVNFAGGYELNSGLLLALNYNLAITNNLTGSDAHIANSHLWYFGISLGYLFGK